MSPGSVHCCLKLSCGISVDSRERQLKVMSVWKRGAQPYKPEAVGRGSEGIYTGGSVCASDLQSL